jgi:hypothetical protein
LAPPGVRTANGVDGTIYVTETLLFGPVLDVAPTLAPDGQVIELRLKATVTEFPGYDM